MLWAVLAPIVGLLLVLQVLLCGPVFQRLVRWRYGGHLSLGFRGPGFILPLLAFRARDFRFLIHGADIDRVYFGSEEVRLRIDPVFLLFFRIRIVDLLLESPYIEYINRLESHTKNRLLPRRHRIEIKRGRVHNGAVYVRDETMRPTYRLELRQIELYNMDMDVATSVDLFFRAERGEAQIAGGRIEIGNSSHEGYVRLWGITWGQIINLESVPFMGSKFALVAYHSGGSDGRKVYGQVGYSSSTVEEDLPDHGGSERYGVNFAFDIDWDDYRVTLDLGLQRLIGNILSSAQSNWLTSGIVMSGRQVFELLRKPES
ncbi:MAG: hypothetical protein KDK35_15180 [Leptospiraceae bacterium]|nr:hypothetical protein [Leptospiraceae bacterium]MCP5484036.1 hypothetical protein [Spirochaetales bacterium]